MLLHVHQLSGCKEDASPEAIARTLRLEGYDDPTHLQKLQPRLYFRLLLLVQKRPSDSEMLCACAQRQLGLTSGGLIGVLHSTAIAAQARSSSSSSNSSDNLAAAAGDASSSMAELLGDGSGGRGRGAAGAAAGGAGAAELTTAFSSPVAAPEGAAAPLAAAGERQQHSITLIERDEARGSNHWKCAVKGEGVVVDTSGFWDPIKPITTVRGATAAVVATAATAAAVTATAAAVEGRRPRIASLALAVGLSLSCRGAMVASVPEARPRRCAPWASGSHWSASKGPLARWSAVVGTLTPQCSMVECMHESCEC